MIRPLLALCLVAALGANEAPSMDAIPAITYAEGDVGRNGVHHMGQRYRSGVAG